MQYFYIGFLKICDSFHGMSVQILRFPDSQCTFWRFSIVQEKYHPKPFRDECAKLRLDFYV